MPTDSINRPMAITSNKANAVNISRSPVRAIMRIRGRIRYRPPRISVAITATTFRPPIQPSPLPWAAATPSTGTMAIIGIAAMSWNSKMAKPALPADVALSLRSLMVASAMAVDESDMPSAAISAVFQSTPTATAAPNSASETVTT